MASSINWTAVQPSEKWRILLRQKRFALWAVFSSIGSMMLGFDWGIAGTVTAFPAFQQRFGIPYPSQPSGYLIPARIQSGWSGASTGGDVLGVMISGQLQDWIGRKHTLIVGTILTAVGVGIQVGSDEWKLFLGGRLINAIGFGIVLLVGPVWIGENVRPELRGFFLCLVNGSIVFGQFTLAVVSYGTSHITGKWSYETVIVLQFVYVAILMLGYPFFPESTYYHLKKNNPEAARKSLNKIHGSDDQELIDAELVRIGKLVTVSEELQKAASKSGWPMLQCFKGTNLKRTMISILPAAAQQLIGAAFVLGYVTYFLELIGVHSYFTVSVILYVVMLLSNLSAFYFIEIIGRRTLLNWGMILLTLIELLMGIMGAVKTHDALWVIVVCIFLWALVYQLTLGATGFAVASEVSSPTLRAPTLSLVAIVQGVLGWVVGFVSPYMINPDAGNLGGEVGFVFFGLGVPLCILFWFFIPETKGLNFDEMDYLFANKVNCRRFPQAISRKRHESTATMVASEEFRKDGTTDSEKDRVDEIA